jgi:hypothetical protein
MEKIMPNPKIEISDETLTALNLINKQKNREWDQALFPTEYNGLWYYKKEYGDSKQHWIGPFSTRSECNDEYCKYLDWMDAIDGQTPFNKLPV